MRIYTAHLRAATAPVLVREGFSLAALVFGPLWLLAHRAWIAGLLSACALLTAAALPAPWQPVALAALAWAHGIFGQDLLRWSLVRRGFLMEHVLAARDAEGALARLLAARPDLAADA